MGDQGVISYVEAHVYRLPPTRGAVHPGMWDEAVVASACRCRTEGGDLVIRGHEVTNTVATRATHVSTRFSYPIAGLAGKLEG